MLRGKFARVLLLMKNDEALNVLDVGFFGSQTEMSQTRSDPHLIQKLGRRHTGSKMAG